MTRIMSKDLIKASATAIFQKMSDALANNDAEGAASAMEEFTAQVCEQIENEFEQYENIADMAVLQSRGLRTLTSEETQWYEKFIDAAKKDVKQAITDLTDGMPVTIIDRVLEDMQKAHPLLGVLNIQNAAGATKLVMNAVQMASKFGSWGAIGSGIANELTGKIKTVDVTTAKYTAYFIIPKDFVKFNFSFAPVWVDQYIRLVLSESVAFGLEKGFVAGDGKGQPIGLAFDVSKNEDGVYTEKEAAVLDDWSKYNDLIADSLLKDANGDFRQISKVTIVVNPIDYVKKIRPAQFCLTNAGVVNIIDNRFPTETVQSVFVEEGTAKLGLPENYFAAINGGQSGTIEYSDEAQFLDDARVYTTRVYAQGRPVDNTSWINLDISKLEAPAFPVFVTNNKDGE
ncbi:MAG: phage major capsid protein [Solobacterium sp.]|nr:phage major capsid protein [Solobacterium sp.]